MIKNCYTHKKFETSIRSRISTEIANFKSRNLVKTIYCYEHRAKKKIQKLIPKILINKLF